MVDDIRFAFTDFGVIQRLVDLMRLGYDPLAVFIVATFLCYLADIDFGIEIGGESHAVIACVTIYNVEIVNLVKMVLGGISRKYGGNTRIESATEDCRKTGSLEPILISPLP